METYYPTPTVTRHARSLLPARKPCTNMSVIGISTILLLTSAGLLVSEGTQAIVAGSVMAGAVISGLSKACHTVLSKSKGTLMPRPLMLVHFLFHVGVGWPVGVALMIWYLQNFDADYLVLRGIVAGAVGAFFGHRIAKIPAVKRFLEDRGLIEKPGENPSPEPPTQKIE